MFFPPLFLSFRSIYSTRLLTLPRAKKHLGGGVSFLSILSRGFPHLNTHTNTLYTHIYIYRSNDTYKDGRIENDRDGCHRGVSLDRVFYFSREWKGTKVRRSGVFGNVRRRTQRLGEIGSRAIHRCVVVFLSLSLVGRTIRARVCVGFKALVVSRLKEIRARDERERCTRKRQFRSAREKRSHHRLVFGRQKHVLFASSSVHFSHQKRQKAQMMILCTTPSFVLCFLSRSHIFDYSPIHSLSLCFSLW